MKATNSMENKNKKQATKSSKDASNAKAARSSSNAGDVKKSRKESSVNKSILKGWTKADVKMTNVEQEKTKTLDSKNLSNLSFYRRQICWKEGRQEGKQVRARESWCYQAY